MPSDVIQFYNSNENFKMYVDKYCNTYRITVEEACTHMMVKNVMEYYQSK